MANTTCAKAVLPRHFSFLPAEYIHKLPKEFGIVRLIGHTRMWGELYWVLGIMKTKLVQHPCSTSEIPYIYPMFCMPLQGLKGLLGR